MSDLSSEQAQQRADRIQAFQQELAQLQAEQVLALEPAQRGAIDQHHRQLLAHYAATLDIDADTRSRQLSLGMRVASLFGALALASSLFFLFHRFWGLLTEVAQVAILLGTSLGSLALTLWLQGRDRSGYYSKLAAEQAAQAGPDDSKLKKARAEAGTALERQLLKNSRLFLVDADLDKQVLRARYPDRLRYALVRGRLKPYLRGYRGEDASAGFEARVDLDIEQINVPHALRAAFPGGRKHFGYGLDKPQAWVEIAFGQRHEPWMVSARRP